MAEADFGDWAAKRARHAAEAERLVVLELEQRTGQLDLRPLEIAQLPTRISELVHLKTLKLGQGNASRGVRGVTDLKGIQSLTRLEVLDCSGTQVSDLAPLAHLKNLSSFDCSSTQVSDLTPLAHLKNLSSIRCSYTQVSDLAPIAHLANLSSLDCSGTQVSTLAPLAQLANLSSLNCSGTEVSDLAPIAHLANLSSLDCSGEWLGPTGLVSNLAPLANLANLSTLNCSSTEVSDLAPLAHLTNLSSLDCSGGWLGPSGSVSDLAPLVQLANLGSLKCSNSKVSDLAPLAHLTNLSLLDCSISQVSDLAPIAHLADMSSLDCSSTQVSDLAPLAHLTNLSLLDCSISQVSDLAPLAQLENLSSLSCSRTRVSDLTPVAQLTNLGSLRCSQTQVSDLAPVAQLTNLSLLDCSDTQVSDLAPVAQLTSLTSFDCSDTQVSDLAPVAQLTSLTSFDCSDTQVSDLSPLSGLAWLEEVDFSSTAVSELLPLLTVPRLEKLRANYCEFRDLPLQLLARPTLAGLYLHRAGIPGLPVELLSSQDYDNCLLRLRSHVADLAAGGAELRRAKVVVLGNGRLGKTQLCRRLQGLPFDESVRTTHGISVTNACCPSVSEDDALNLWDFGGQDLYHGTHALFLKTRAVFVVAWSPEFEQAGEVTVDGTVFRNQPVAYWLDYVRTLSEYQSPVVIVQTRCDRREDEVPVPPTSLAGLEPPPRLCCFSAKKSRGQAALAEAIREAIEYIREREGISTIGRGRLQVLETLERWRDEDAQLPHDARQHRTLNHAQFVEVCNDAGGVSSPEHLLEYLHELGVVFYRRKVFGDTIVLDQSWALEAVYAVFEREKSHRQIVALDGRFTRALLELTVWGEYRKDEQRLFLSFMQSAGVCFERRAEDERAGVEAEYVAPDLLPPKARIENQLFGRFDAREPALRLEYTYPFLPAGLLRGLIAEIGARAKESGVYWQTGVWAYDQDSGARLLLERAQDSVGQGHGGRIVVRLQGAKTATPLIDWLRKCFRTHHARYGYHELEPTIDELPPASKGDEQRRAARESPKTVMRGETEPGTEHAQPERAEPSLGPLPAGAFPQRGSEIYVSYAWGDASAEGQRRAQIVDALCSALARHDRKIHRDKVELKDGDRITEFMNRLIAGDAIILVISDKYLKSPACMYELFGIYRRCWQDSERFLRAAVPVVLPDANIADSLERAKYAKFWKARLEQFQTAMRELEGYGGVELSREFQRVNDFALHVGDILSLLQDQLVPRDLQTLEQDDFRALRALIDRQLAK